MVVLLALAAGLVAARSGLTTTVIVVTEPAPAVITADVERRVLEDSLTTRGTVAITDVTSIHGPTPEGSRPVITSIKVAVADQVDEGDVVASIAGRPIIVLQGAFPAFRELARGIEGVDVAQLQEALTRLGLYRHDVDGIFGRATERSVRELYRQSGYEPAVAGGEDANGQATSAGSSSSTSIHIPLDEVMFVPELPARVVAVNGDVGDVADDESALLEVSTGEVRIAAAVPAEEAGRIASGMHAAVLDEGSGTTLDAEVVAVSPQPKVDSGRLVHDVELRPLRPVSELVGKNVRVTFVLSASSGPVLVVPITAVWTGDGGRVFVTRLDGEMEDDIEIQPGLVIDGWVEILEADGALAEGDMMIVSP